MLDSLMPKTFCSNIMKLDEAKHAEMFSFYSENHVKNEWWDGLAYLRVDE
jgi:hypothetical protein